MAMHIVDIPVPPCPKPRMTRSDKWKQRPAVMRYRQFKDDLREVIKGELDPRFKIVFHVPLPKSWSEKKKIAFDGQPHQVKPDVDNYLKAFMDAMSSDDSYIYDVHCQKYWAREGKITLMEYRDE